MLWRLAVLDVDVRGEQVYGLVSAAYEAAYEAAYGAAVDAGE